MSFSIALIAITSNTSQTIKNLTSECFCEAGNIVRPVLSNGRLRHKGSHSRIQLQFYNCCSIKRNRIAFKIKLF